MRQYVVTPVVKAGTFTASDFNATVYVRFPWPDSDPELEIERQTFSKSDLKELIDFLILLHDNI